MEKASDEDVALVYIRLVRRESLAAAVVIEQIHTQFGPRAALRAALVIVLLKTEIQRFASLTKIEMYTYLLNDAQEALPLLQEAISCCLECWGIPQSDKSAKGKWQQPVATRKNVLPDPFEELLQRIRQYSPITVVKLEAIRRDYEITAGGYAATALIWLEAYRQKFGAGFLRSLTDKEIQDLSFAKYMHENQQALDQFIEMLDCYRIEQLPVTIATFNDAYHVLEAERQAGRREDRGANGCAGCEVSFMSNHAELDALLIEIQTLAQLARTKGNEYPSSDHLAHYWFGVAAGYEDAAERLGKALL